MARPQLRLHEASQYSFRADTVKVHVVFGWIAQEIPRVIPGPWTRRDSATTPLSSRPRSLFFPFCFCLSLCMSLLHSFWGHTVFRGHRPPSKLNLPALLVFGTPNDHPLVPSRAQPPFPWNPWKMEDVKFADSESTAKISASNLGR